MCRAGPFAKSGRSGVYSKAVQLLNEIHVHPGHVLIKGDVAELLVRHADEMIWC